MALRPFGLSLISLLTIAPACGDGGDSNATTGDTPVVKTTSGEVRGDRSGESIRYLKLPYAQPPVGPLRWKAPVAPSAWEGVRKEPAFGSACAQEANSQGPGSTSEDCLYLNVWTPASKATKAPVMVWIHGGGNFAGSAADKVPDPLAAPASLPLFYDGQYFAARHGVVVVTLNYRLGPFGFFSHPALADEGSPRGNQGLLDQQFALSWVHDNIAAFGGDPNNVTIFGESAGSADVCYHVVSPKSRGLFHRAVSESGGCTASPTGGRDQTAEETASAMRAYAKAVGCEDGADVLTCLRALPVDPLLSNGMQPDPTSGFFGEAAWRFSVVVDGAGGFLPASARAQFEAGDVAKVPYILGSNNDEGSLFTFTTSVPDEQTYLSLLKKGYGDNADKVAAQYPGSKFANDFRTALSHVIGDAGLICGTHDSARRAQKAGLPVFMYNFNVPWKISFGILGAAHGSEISSVFGNPYMADATDTRVSTAMNAYWAAFARTGEPTFEGAPTPWPAFAPSTSDADQRLQLDGNFAVLDNFRKEECAFWRGLYDATQ